MSRHLSLKPFVRSPRNLRLGALVLVFVAINQIDDALVGATVVEELLYWVVRLSVLVSGLWLADMLVARMPAQQLAKPAWLRPVVIVSAIGLLPFALAEVLIEPYLPIRPEYVDDDLREVSALLVYLGEYITILSIILPVHLVLWLILERNASGQPGPVSVESAPLPDFLQRSAVASANEVLALQAEEHYVRVFSADGSELIHCRFRDAVEDMPDGLGLQVHRSWWVADSAVRSASRGSRRWQLTLDSEVTVPVSDSYVAVVREKGWLRGRSR